MKDRRCLIANGIRVNDRQAGNGVATPAPVIQGPGFRDNPPHIFRKVAAIFCSTFLMLFDVSYIKHKETETTSSAAIAVVPEHKTKTPQDGKRKETGR
ncbi:hypothetical protein CBM2592_B70008 [Cupriavidus taiwanensis]|nr:hypothetical protein CBM2588_B50008 [Cupriavidus taiwanensis]SOY72505.1 hypothetical protein CBM2592_B70008 [Cupriavidus taiwanensis]SOY96196.1 hypothetical protein CBM2591_B40043 [Cupriavidus taiwanensis]SOZ75305.1 hypothetical protein CBM2617_B90008 [Cupriavidus taiwanensis]SOZ89155.1 hypothetical protein CBM2618_B80008 [Cupriavidus taiwanensis]